MNSPDDQFSLQFTGYRLLRMPYRRVRDIMAEFDPNENTLKQALRVGHGIDIPDDSESAGCNLELVFVIDQQMSEKLAQYRITSPTLLQLLGTARVISTTDADAKARFEAMMKEEN